jgi:hypothetical protein
MRCWPSGISAPAFPSTNKHQRIHLLDDHPGRRRIVSKDSIHKTNWSISGRSPSSWEEARVVESDDPGFYHIRVPVIPILFNRLFLVISVDHQKVDWPVPYHGRFMAKGFDPYNLGSRFPGDRASSRSAQKVQRAHSRKMEWIHEIKCALLIHRGPKRHRGSTFGNTDFHQTLASSSVLLQRVMFCLRVLRNRRTQSSPPEKRMFHCTRSPHLRLSQFRVDLGELNPWRSHSVSGPNT